MSNRTTTTGSLGASGACVHRSRALHRLPAASPQNLSNTLPHHNTASQSPRVNKKTKQKPQALKCQGMA